MDVFNRRGLLTGTTALAGLTVLGTSTSASVPAGRDPFDYEVTRTEAEWREMLGDDYAILREGRTEEPRSSPLWAEARQGTYACRGCDLLHYRSETKVNLLKGWLFFKGSEPNAQLMSQDTGVADVDDEDPNGDFKIEVHCRRCGSHTGHIVLVDGLLLHCVNGASLSFTDTAA
jgi:Conserved domain frequently associated with peptide methionine sulfoxide reductase